MTTFEWEEKYVKHSALNLVVFEPEIFFTKVQLFTPSQSPNSVLLFVCIPVNLLHTHLE
jgi:hypothetical protein